jgi:hypothetical protein
VLGLKCLDSFGLILYVRVLCYRSGVQLLWYDAFQSNYSGKRQGRRHRMHARANATEFPMSMHRKKKRDDLSTVERYDCPTVDSHRENAHGIRLGLLIFDHAVWAYLLSVVVRSLIPYSFFLSCHSWTSKNNWGDIHIPLLLTSYNRSRIRRNNS